MKKDDLKIRNSRAERLCRMLDISPEVLPSVPAIEILGRSLVKIRGGGAILLYTPSEIRIALPKGEYVSLKGEELCCTSYNRGVLGVEGVIGSVSFERCESGSRGRK